MIPRLQRRSSLQCRQSAAPSWMRSPECVTRSTALDVARARFSGLGIPFASALVEARRADTRRSWLQGRRLPVKLRLLRCTNAHTGAADVRPPWVGESPLPRHTACIPSGNVPGPRAADVRLPCGLENPLAKPIRFLFNGDHRRSTGTSAHAGDDTATATAFAAASSAVRRALVEALARVRCSNPGGLTPAALDVARASSLRLTVSFPSRLVEPGRPLL